MGALVVNVGVLLAAGRSRRFGEANKLLAPFRGKLLISYAAGTMKSAGLDTCVAVVSNDLVAEQLTGFQIAKVSTSTQAESLRAGLNLAQKHGAQRIVVMLADMPLITVEIVHSVMALCDESTPSAITNGGRRSPPACFPKAMFDQIELLSGDSGAKTILHPLSDEKLVTVGPEYLRDIDEPNDLLM